MGKAGLKLKTKALVCHSVLVASDRSEQHNKRTTKFDSQEQAEIYSLQLRTTTLSLNSIRDKEHSSGEPRDWTRSTVGHGGDFQTTTRLSSTRKPR